MRNNLPVGGLLSVSQGDIDYIQNQRKRKYTHKMTSVHHYLAWTDGEANLWGSVGYGQSKLKIKKALPAIPTPACYRWQGAVKSSCHNPG